MKTFLLTAFFVLATLVSSAQWTYTELPQPKEMMGSASVGNKVYFAGGSDETKFYKDVKFYDLETGTWSDAGELSVARQIIGGTTTCGSKIFFAGGFDYATTFNAVDIYDTQTNTWTTGQLSVDRLDFVAVSHGNLVLFAGGFQYPSLSRKNIVDVYNILTGVWSVTYLSQAREGIAAAVVGDKAIFAGGIINGSGATTNRVDIYNFTTNTWDPPASLSQARGCASATTVGSKVVIAGGVVGFNMPTDQVDIYDANTGTWSTAKLSAPRSDTDFAVTVVGKAYFAGGGIFAGNGFYAPSNVIDIYDPDIFEPWSVINLLEPRVHHSVVSVGDYLVVAGGKNDNGLVSLVEIYQDPFLGFGPIEKEDDFFSIFPNPCTNILTISSDIETKTVEAVIYNQAGQKVLQEKPVNNTLDVSNLNPGMYIIELVNENGKTLKKLIIQ
jgi:kelch-like protein 20